MANNGLGSFNELFVSPNAAPKPSVPKPSAAKQSGAKPKGAGQGKSKNGAKHDHPACETDHVHEKAYVTSSAGGEITEGCKEHYYDRIVAVEEIAETVKTNGKLMEYMVMGEILLNPKFKGRRRYF